MEGEALVPTKPFDDFAVLVGRIFVEHDVNLLVGRNLVLMAYHQRAPSRSVGKPRIKANGSGMAHTGSSRLLDASFAHRAQASRLSISCRSRLIRGLLSGS